MSTPLFQKLFDKGCRGVIAQGCKSYRPAPNTLSGIRCVYDNGQGAKCFVGQLIPPGMYTPALDYNWKGTNFGASITHLVVGGYIPDIPDDADTAVEFLRDCQFAHDTCEYDNGPAFVDKFKDAMRRVAITWNLNPAVLNEEPANVEA